MSGIKKHVYVASLFTYTPQAYVIRSKTGDPHTHAAMGLESPLKEMYSFNIGWWVVNGGFAVEKFSDYVPTAMVSVWRAPVTEAEHKRLRNFVDRFRSAPEKTAFNYMGIAAAGLLKKDVDAGQHTKYCSQFIKHALVYAGLERLVPPRSRGRDAATPYSFAESGLYELYARGTAARLAETEERA